MSDENDEKEEKGPNVFSLTGDPYEPPEKGLENACKETITCAEEILSYAKANQIRGLYAIGWSPAHQRFVRWCMMPSEETEHGAALRFMGGLDVGKADLLAMALDQIIIIDDDGNPME